MTQKPRPISAADLATGALRLTSRLPGLVHAARIGLRGNPRRRDSLGAALERNAHRVAGHDALLWTDQALTWSELNATVNRYAHVFASDGVRSGDVVAVVLQNRPDVLFVVGALAKLGAIAALVPWQQRGDVLAHSLGASRAHRVVTEPALREAVDDALALVPRLGGTLVFVAGALDDAAAIQGGIDLDARVRRAPRVNPRTTGRVRLGDPCFYIFTSGTTGLPKASVMSHMRWLKAGAVYGRALLGLSPGEVLYSPLPLYHNLALTVAWGAATDTGAALAIRDRFSATAFWDDCRHFRAGAIAYIGEIPRYLLQQPASPRDRDHQVTRMTGVGMRPDLWQPFRQRFGIERICETYSASEGNTMFFNLLDVDGTIGFCPSPHRLVAFDADTGAPLRDGRGRAIEVPSGEPGLLLGEVTRRYTFDGYTDAAASDAKLVRDAFSVGDVWFNSGDVLRDVGFGHHVFVDRIGDTFRWKSENVSTQQVEAALHQVTGVAECTVYGVDVPGIEGRAGMAALTLDGTFDPERTARELDDRLPTWAVPVFVRVREAIEVTGTFKHRKVSLRDEGFDPATVDDPLWFRAAGDRAYQPLDEAAHGAITAGRVRL